MCVCVEGTLFFNLAAILSRNLKQRTDNSFSEQEESQFYFDV